MEGVRVAVREGEVVGVGEGVWDGEAPGERVGVGVEDKDGVVVGVEDGEGVGVGVGGGEGVWDVEEDTVEEKEGVGEEEGVEGGGSVPPGRITRTPAWAANAMVDALHSLPSKGMSGKLYSSGPPHPCASPKL